MAVISEIRRQILVSPLLLVTLGNEAVETAL
jgi:hypothetical protein